MFSVDIIGCLFLFANFSAACWNNSCILWIFTSPAGAVAKYCDEYVCLSVCLSVREDTLGTTRAIFTKFLCMLPMSVARSSSGMLTIGRIAYRREGVDESAQCGRNVIYDCFVFSVACQTSTMCSCTSLILHICWLIMAALRSRCGHYIFVLFLSIFFYLFPSPNISGRRLDVYHTSTHGVALVRI